MMQAAQLSWMDRNPAWGPGRSDPFNPAKAQLLELGPDGTVGNSDPPPLWNMKARHALHWDGLNDSLHEIVVNSGIGNGASGRTINMPNLARMQAWMTSLRPPSYPFPTDRVRAARGEVAYNAWVRIVPRGGSAPDRLPRCAGPARNRCLPARVMGRPRGEPLQWPQRLSLAIHALSRHLRVCRRPARRRVGACAVPAQRVGPDLADVLKPPAERPTTFYRGYDVYEPVRGGFVADGDAAQAQGWMSDDTRLPGNSNRGHTWGTDLPDAAKLDLLEYLKTL